MAKVTVYSTSSCPWCVRLKEFLGENKVEFEEKNVGEDAEAAQEMFTKSKQMGVPVSDINGEIIVGFDKPKLKKALKLE